MATTPNAREPIRIPLVGQTFARSVNQASAASSKSGIIGIGVVGTFIIGLTVSSTKDQHFINCYPEKLTNPLTNGESFFLIKRPGFATNTTPEAGSIGSAVHVWAGQGSGTSVISSFGATNSTVYNEAVSIGTTSGKVVAINDTLVGATANLLFATDNNTGYFYPEAGSLTLINDIDFPGNIAGQTITGGFIPLNGYNFIMTKQGKIYNSDVDSMSAWDATSFLSANIRPDAGLGLIRYKNYIGAFGKESLEFFQNVVNAAGSPLQSVPNAYINIGAVNQYAFKEMDDTIVWLGQTAQSRVALYMLEGLTPKKLSTPAIDALLSIANPANMYLNTLSLAGQTFVVIVSGSDNTTYVYNLENQSWHEWSSATILWHHMTGISSGTKAIYAVSEADTAGKVFLINPVNYVFTDNGVNYLVTIQTSLVDLDTSHRKRLAKLWIVGETDTSTNNVDVSWSDDDYVTFSTARTIDLSTNSPFLNVCGMFRRRAFKLTQNNTRPLRLSAMDLLVDKMAH